MELLKHLEILYNDSANPCYFTDWETDRLVFVNGAMQKKLQLFENLAGRKCYEVIHNQETPCEFCAKSHAKEFGFVEQRIYNKVLQSPQRANSLKMEVGGHKLFMTKYFVSSVDERRAEAEHSFEDAMTHCIEILGEVEQDKAIASFIELLGKFYSAEVCYIYEFDKDHASITQHYHWHSQGDYVHLPKNKKELRFILGCLAQEKHSDIFEIEPSSLGLVEDLLAEKILTQYNISNAVVSKLKDKSGNILGLVGMNNCSEPVYDRRLLTAISRFVTDHFSRQSMISTLATINDVDLLTGFYNRNVYAKKIVELQEHSPNSLGVLFVNLNGLRKTNEYFGFDVGDQQIKKAVHLLREFYSEDFYRISGDEFVAFLENYEKEVFLEKVNSLQRKLRDTTQESAFSVGSSWDSGYYQVTELVKIADTIMVINKQEYYFNAMSDSQEIQNAVMQEVFRAIAEDEFLVYLQPQINLDTEEVVGAEALIRRFDKKNNRMVFPDHFIPLYEMNNVIRHVDLYMVRKISQILFNWRSNQQELPISINLSRVTLTEFGIVKTIGDIVDQYGVPHELIVIEVTERVGMIENEVTMNLVDEFKAAGFRLSLDDFGSAYSNIVTLADIAVDEVKIDKSLVDNLISNPKNRIIVKNMLLMCNELENIFTLAEGIETEEQAEFLRSVHCQLGQGYLYSRPIPNEEFYEKYLLATAE